MSFTLNEKFSLATGLLVQEPFKAAFWLILLGLLIIGYFAGSLNFAVIVSRLLYKEDVRQKGSKNAGLTNMLRVYGKKAAAFTLVGDVFKTVLPCMLGRVLFGDTGVALAGLGCVIGHVFPVYYRFRGGKGVLTTAAMVLCLNPVVFAVLIAFFALIVWGTKYVSLGSIICALLFPIIFSKAAEPNIFPVAVSMILAVTVVVLHHENIKRLFNGEESKISFGSDKKN